MLCPRGTGFRWGKEWGHSSYYSFVARQQSKVFSVCPLPGRFHPTFWWGPLSGPNLEPEMREKWPSDYVAVIRVLTKTQRLLSNACPKPFLTSQWPAVAFQWWHCTLHSVHPFHSHSYHTGSTSFGVTVLGIRPREQRCGKYENEFITGFKLTGEK